MFTARRPDAVPTTRRPKGDPAAGGRSAAAGDTGRGDVADLLKCSRSRIATSTGMSSGNSAVTARSSPNVTTSRSSPRRSHTDEWSGTSPGSFRSRRSDTPGRRADPSPASAWTFPVIAVSARGLAVSPTGSVDHVHPQVLRDQLIPTPSWAMPAWPRWRPPSGSASRWSRPPVRRPADPAAGLAYTVPPRQFTGLPWVHRPARRPLAAASVLHPTPLVMAGGGWQPGRTALAATGFAVHGHHRGHGSCLSGSESRRVVGPTRPVGRRLPHYPSGPRRDRGTRGGQC
jgi:hypothetical protein